MPTPLLILLFILNAGLFFCLGVLVEMRFTNEVIQSWKNTIDKWDKDLESFIKLLNEKTKE